MRCVKMVADTPPPSSRSDEDAWCAALVERVVAGETRALEVLYDRYARPAYSLAHRVTGDPTFAEETVQEVFLAVWRQPERFEARRGGFASWLLSAVHHKAVDAVRREEAVRRRAIALQAVEGLDPSDPPANRPDEAVEERLRGERVRRALRDLPDSQREALTLAYYGGYTQREIASLTSTPIGTVKTRMHRAMHSLRSSLDDLSDLHGLAVSDEPARGTGGARSGATTSTDSTDIDETGSTDTKGGTR
jgi:RNA polymerase sigma-70 factor (ECF subfamily)